MASFRPVSSPATAVGHELTRAEHAQLRCALGAQSTVNMAEGALTVLAAVPIENAGRLLADLAAALGVDVPSAARLVLNLAQRRALPDPVADELHRVLPGYEA